MPAISRSRISTGPHEWICAAPGCLPNPTTAILVQPLSIGPLKQVCGLTRLTGRMRSAPAACAIEVQRHSIRGASDDLGLHRRSDLGSDRFLRDAEVGEHGPLTIGGGTAVAPHRRHDERLGTEGVQPGDRAPQQLDPPDQTTAPAADRHRHPRRHLVRQDVTHGRFGHRRDVADPWRRGSVEDHFVQRRHGDRRIERQLDPRLELVPTHASHATPDG